MIGRGSGTTRYTEWKRKSNRGERGVENERNSGQREGVRETLIYREREDAEKKEKEG